MQKTLALVSGWLCAALSLSACAYTVDDADGDDEPVGEAEQQIRNGTHTLQRGVVQIHFPAIPGIPAGRRCTGAMIAPEFLLTAASCLQGYVPSATQQGELHATVFYFDPDTGKRQVTGVNHKLYGYIKSTWDGEGDAQDDIAVLHRVGAWSSTDPSDYLRLSRGSCSQIDRSTFYGAGVQNDAGSVDGELYKMSINVSWCGPHHFFNLEGTSAICRGDAGGPYLVRTADAGGYEVLAGLANVVDWENDCATDGGKQRAVRMNDDKVGWIESVMGKACHSFSSNGHPYERCW
jgi:hypothetical protein